MSYRRRHRWFRRMALGLAFASVMFAGRVSVAAAKIDEGVSDQPAQVIPYLSHGILTEADAQSAAAEAIHDPYLTDVFVRPGEELAGPDGQAPANRVERALQDPQVIPYLSHGILTETDAQIAAAEAIGDPNLSRLDGDQLAIENAIGERFVAGVTDFPSVQVDTPPVRPDDVADRFAHSDVPSRPELAGSTGSSIEWNEALTAGLGAFALVLGLGLAFGYLKRPKLAGL